MLKYALKIAYFISAYDEVFLSLKHRKKNQLSVIGNCVSTAVFVVWVISSYLLKIMKAIRCFTMWN